MFLEHCSNHVDKLWYILVNISQQRLECILDNIRYRLLVHNTSKIKKKHVQLIILIHHVEDMANKCNFRFP